MMPRKFIDTSAVFKLYRMEPNTALVQSQITVRNTLLIAQITGLEFQSAFYGPVRQRLITLLDAQNYNRCFLFITTDAVLARLGAASGLTVLP